MTIRSRAFSLLRAMALLGAVAALSLVQLNGGSHTTARALETPDTCAAGSATLAGAAASDGESPAGFVLNPLGEGQIDRVPSPPVRLQLTRLSFEPRSDTGQREATGPIIYYVESGELSIAVGGKLAQYQPGASTFVPMDEIYQVVNAADEAASVLGVALADPDAKVFPVANVLPLPTPSGMGESLSAKNATSTVLFQADLDTLPDLPTRLFLACAAWTMPPDPSDALAPSGPVGLRVTSGTFLRDDRHPIREAGCIFFAQGDVHATGAGDVIPSGVLFGILPVGQSLWQPVGVPAAGAGAQAVTCGQS